MRHLLLTTLLLPLSVPAWAHPSSRWQQAWDLDVDSTRAAISTTAPRLRLVQRGDDVQVWVDLGAAGPWQLQLRTRGGTQPGLPLQRLVNGPSTQLLLTLPPGPTRHLVLDAVAGPPGSPADARGYALPFDPSRPIRIHQGAHGRYSHQDEQNRHAWDFALSEGTPVLAARAGRVMEVVDHATGPVQRPGDGGNWIRVLHEDGSMAVYAHLQAGSLAVRPGQLLRQGQLLARSGNTGSSSGPHLHFVVQRNAGLRLESIPVQLDGPRGRLQAPGHNSLAP